MAERNGHHTHGNAALLTMQETVRTFLGTLTSRLGLGTALGSTHQGARQIEEVLGYKGALTYRDFKQAYTRYDLAQRLVNIYPEETWSQVPTVREEDEALHETDFETGWAALAKRLQIQTLLHRADILANLGHYAVLLLGLRGQPVLQQPARLVTGGEEDLLYLELYSEEFIEVSQFGRDASLPTYGRPIEYRLIGGGGQPGTLRQPERAGTLIHASRVIHIPGERRLDNELYGLPLLEAVYNKLVDLLKIVGGSAEMFWRDAKRRIAVELQDGFTLSSEAARQIEEEVEEFQHGLRDFLRLTGMEARNLSGAVASPKEHFEVVMQSITGTLGVPLRTLLGTEEGVLAGDQDADLLLRRAARRQIHYAEADLLRPLIDRCVALQILSPPLEDYVVDWGRLRSMPETQRAAIAKDWATAMHTYASGMAPSVVPVEEFREVHLGLPAVPELGELEEPPEDEGVTEEDEPGEEEDDEGDAEETGDEAA